MYMIYDINVNVCISSKYFYIHIYISVHISSKNHKNVFLWLLIDPFALSFNSLALNLHSVLTNHYPVPMGRNVSYSHQTKHSLAFSLEYLLCIWELHRKTIETPVISSFDLIPQPLAL